MAETLFSKVKRAWNAFSDSDWDRYVPAGQMISSSRPDRVILSRGNEKTIVTAIYNRIAMDVAALDYLHVQLDENGRFVKKIDDDLNHCLEVEANIDQTSRAFVQDAILSMFDWGTIAICPIDTDQEPNQEGDIVTRYYTMRIGEIIEWRPRQVLVRCYNDRTGQFENITFDKANVGIVQNPFYAIINEPNSMMKRLVHKLNLLDAIDEQSASGKLDLIIQLPYVIKTEARKTQAESRRKQIEEQLMGSKYGIAYTDSTEKITQLNRAVENNLMTQIEYLTSMVYAQLGITQSVLDGTADESTMLNYNNRSVEPCASALTDELYRKFLTTSQREKMESISFFRDPFKLVPVSQIAEIADKFTRNEILTSNEIRQVIGMKPSKDPKADELRNKNLSQSKVDQQTPTVPTKADQTVSVKNSKEGGKT